MAVLISSSQQRLVGGFAVMAFTAQSRSSVRPLPPAEFPIPSVRELARLPGIVRLRGSFVSRGLPVFQRRHSNRDGHGVGLRARSCSPRGIRTPHLSARIFLWFSSSLRRALLRAHRRRGGISGRCSRSLVSGCHYAYCFFQRRLRRGSWRRSLPSYSGLPALSRSLFSQMIPKWPRHVLRFMSLRRGLHDGPIVFAPSVASTNFTGLPSCRHFLLIIGMVILFFMTRRAIHGRQCAASRGRTTPAASYNIFKKPSGDRARVGGGLKRQAWEHRNSVNAQADGARCRQQVPHVAHAEPSPAHSTVAATAAAAPPFRSAATPGRRHAAHVSHRAEDARAIRCRSAAPVDRTPTKPAAEQESVFNPSPSPRFSAQLARRFVSCWFDACTAPLVSIFCFVENIDAMSAVAMLCKVVVRGFGERLAVLGDRAFGVRGSS